MAAVIEAVKSKRHAADYVNACGSPEARMAVANYHSYPEHAIIGENVIIANGCSGALELALTALLDPGTVCLVPRPGFPLYQVIAESHGASVAHYSLMPDREWEVDLDHLEEIMATYRTSVRCLVINNPSNPTGGVFSERHLEQLLSFANKHRLPILSDEVYGDLTFGTSKFFPMAQVAAKLGRQVPVITASGLAKQFLLPGWRVGWICFNDK
jgi:tyrosine aminotransferase